MARNGEKSLTWAMTPLNLLGEDWTSKCQTLNCYKMLPLLRTQKCHITFFLYLHWMQINMATHRKQAQGECCVAFIISFEYFSFAPFPCYVIFYNALATTHSSLFLLRVLCLRYCESFIDSYSGEHTFCVWPMYKKTKKKANYECA